jgi:hypothetical protein
MYIHILYICIFFRLKCKFTVIAQKPLLAKGTSTVHMCPLPILVMPNMINDYGLVVGLSIFYSFNIWFGGVVQPSRSVGVQPEWDGSAGGGGGV